MSKIALQGNASGTGVFTFVSPNSNTDRTFNLPDSSGTLVNTAPGTSGNVLISDGTNWTSQALPAGGVTSLNGQTGAITNTDLYAIGSYVIGRPRNSTTNYSANTTVAGSSLYSGSPGLAYYGSTWYMYGQGTVTTNPPVLVNVGTWRCVSSTAYQSGLAIYSMGLWVRIS